jgi:hypothetical protein
MHAIINFFKTLIFFIFLFSPSIGLALSEIDKKVLFKMTREGAVCTAYFKALYSTTKRLPDFAEKKTSLEKINKLQENSIKYYSIASEQVGMPENLFKSNAVKKYKEILGVTGKQFSHSSRLEFIYQDTCLQYATDPDAREKYWKDYEIKKLKEKPYNWKTNKFYTCFPKTLDKDIKTQYMSIISFAPEDESEPYDYPNAVFLRPLDGQHQRVLKTYRNDDKGYFGANGSDLTQSGTIVQLNKEKNTMELTLVWSPEKILKLPHECEFVDKK